MVETPKAQARLEKLFLPFPVRPVTVRFKAFRLFWPEQKTGISPPKSPLRKWGRLEAQRQAVASHVAAAGGEVMGKFRKVESGKRAECLPPAAIATLLVIAKPNRLARNTRFLLSVVQGSGEAGVVFCDLPTVPAGSVGKFLITQMAAVAELEAGLISQHRRAVSV